MKRIRPVRFEIFSIAIYLLVCGLASGELFAAPTESASKTPVPLSKTAQGAHLLANHHVHEAIQMFEEVLAKDPRNYEALQGMAWCHLEEEKLDLAISELTRVIALRRNFSMAYVTRARAYYENHETNLALKDCAKVVAISTIKPELHEIYHLRGRIYRSLRQYDNAKADFDAAIKLEPNDSGLYWNRGNVFMDTGKYDKAINDYNEAIRCTKANDEDRLARYHSSRADAYEKNGQKQLAAEDRKKINSQVDGELHDLFDH